MCCERTVTPPFGLAGGRARRRRDAAVARTARWRRCRPLNSKGAFRVPPDGRVVMEAPGSGGLRSAGGARSGPARRRCRGRLCQPRSRAARLPERRFVSGAGDQRWRRFAARSRYRLSRNEIRAFREGGDGGRGYRRDIVPRRAAWPGRRHPRHLHALRRMRPGVPDGRAGRSRPGKRGRYRRRVSSICLPAAPGTKDAERWAQVCTNSGKCIPACDYGINPRFMVNMARIAAKAKLGDDAVRRGAQQYFTSMARSTRVDRAAAAAARSAGPDQPAAARRRRI